MTLSRLLVDLHWDPKLISPFFVLELEWPEPLGVLGVRWGRLGDVLGARVRCVKGVLGALGAR